MSDPPQLPLPFLYEPSFAAADFLPAPSNHAALDWLRRTRDWPDRRLALWGQAGSGKTHLLHVWSRSIGATLQEGPSLRELPPVPPGRAVAIDDAGAVPDETLLLHLLNAAHEAAVPVLLAARTPPARWPVRLPDLASRLRAMTAIPIDPPEESLLRALLARLLADRQLAVDVDIQDYLLLRLPRSAAALREAVARLDRAALAGGGATRKVAAAVVAGMTDVDADDGTDGGRRPTRGG